MTAASLIAPDTASLKQVVYGGTGETEGSGGGGVDDEEWSGVSVGAFPMPIREAQAVASEAAAHIQNGTFTASQMAVLYRTQRQSKAMESALIDAGVPYQVVGGLSFFQRKAVKDLVAYMRLLINPVRQPVR